MTTDLELVNRIRKARDELQDAMHGPVMPVKVKLHLDWVSRFASLSDDHLIVPTRTHSQGLRFHGSEVEFGTDREIAVIVFADGESKTFVLGEP